MNIFSYFVKALGGTYESDLRGDSSLVWDAQVLSDVPDSKFTPDEWRALCEYVTQKNCAVATVQEAKQYLLAHVHCK